MSAEYVRFEDLDDASDKLTTYIDVAVQKHVRESERRLRTEIQAFRAEFQAFRERHDAELAQVYVEFGRIQEVLMWMAQRLPQEPISPPPAQFLKHSDGESI